MAQENTEKDAGEQNNVRKLKHNHTTFRQNFDWHVSSKNINGKCDKINILGGQEIHAIPLFFKTSAYLLKILTQPIGTIK